MEGRHKIREEHIARAKKICGEILGGVWTNSAAIHASVMSGGYVSFMIACELQGKIRSQDAPRKVRVGKSKSYLLFRVLSQ